MRILGYDFSIKKSVPPYNVPQPTQPSSYRNWWWPVIREPYTGAWQRDVELRAESIITYFAVYSAISLISTDIGKLRLRLMQLGDNGLWEEVNVPAFSPVLRKPNHYQTRQKFIEQWMISKLIQGNTYVLKERDARGVVVRLYILEPHCTKVLVAPDGSIWYEVNADNLSGVLQPVRIPASEIIHDVMVPLFHPLCGVSPLIAAALPVAQGLNIQKSSSMFFAKGSRPGGIVTAPGPITEEQAKQFKHEWEQNFTGDNAGRVAIVGDGMKYESLGMPAEEAQLIEQLKWTAENVASVFHVPAHMIGVAAAPAYDQNIEARTQQYYAQCLQTHIESIEALLDEGLGLAKEGQAQVYGTEFDLEDLLRMDTKTKVETTANSIRAGFLSPNEARAKFNMGPTKGGESPIVQQQMFTLDGIAERDAALLAPKPAPAPAAPEPDAAAEEPPVNVDRVIALSRLYH
jgi:HK97 family phage portal protein